MARATGRRKEAVARVRVAPGSGRFFINGERSLEDYFPRPVLRMVVTEPLRATNTMDRYDIAAIIDGGGMTGQAGALRHGIARALCEIDPTLRGELKRKGLLTRDARVKERRKYGLKKARKAPQYSKR
ncbi:MAG TPA: 30S ribosomal protein S9 [Actinomycetota bacterium]